MPRVLDNILEELNLSIKQNLDAITDFTNLGTNSVFYNETRSTTKDDQRFPVILERDYKGQKISIDDRYYLTIYHRVVSDENETDANRGYGSKSYRERIYKMRMYCFGTLRYLNNPAWDYNVDIKQILFRTIPFALSQNERILPTSGSSDVLAVMNDEFEGAITKNLIVRHTACYIDYDIRQRSDCGSITNDPIAVFSDIEGLTGNSTVI